MRARLVWIACGLLAVPLSFGGCSDDSNVTSAETMAPLPCDVDAILATNCRTCHGETPRFGAPMPLMTHADLHAPAVSDPSKKVYELVRARTHDDAQPMPPPPNARLTESDRALVDAWIDRGAPKGTEACSNEPPVDTVTEPLDCTADQKIRPTSKYKVNDATDQYVCYGFDTKTNKKRHVIAGAPRVANSRVVHHVLLYQANEAVSGTPTPCGAGGGIGWRLVTGWAPGGRNFELPAEAGFAEEPWTKHWAVQIHYNNVSGLANEVDDSGYDLCTTDALRPNDADVLATGTFAISIQPRSKRTTTCEMEVPESFGTIHVVSSWPHMHRLGRAERAVRIRSGEETVLLDAPTYDFNTGATAQSVRVDVTSGDMLRTTCAWKNETDATVSFGEGTGDEMCFAFLTYYPKILLPGFAWHWPSAPQFSKCTSVDE